MKSINKLKITGTIASNLVLVPGKSIVRFTLAHYFGGGRKTLFLPCICTAQTAVEVYQNVVVTAYVRPGKNGVEAFVTEIQPNK